MITRVSPGVMAMLGGAVWLAFAGWTVSDLRSFSWSMALLGFVALVLMPLVLDLIAEPDEPPLAKNLPVVSRWLQFPAAMLLMVSCLCAPGIAAVLWATPWIFLTLLLAWLGVKRIRWRGIVPYWAFCRDIGLVFIAVGGAWTMADRLGLHPLGFGADIVQLTAVHFHFAGLVLPIVTGLVMREFSAFRSVSVAGSGVLAGVPLVAFGITMAQLGHSHLVEFIAALVLASSAMGVASFQLRLAGNFSVPAQVRILWRVAGLSLALGMMFAVLYSARTYFSPLAWLDVPWMRALHGTTNAVGFAGCALIGWHLKRRRSFPTPVEISSTPDTAR